MIPYIVGGVLAAAGIVAIIIGGKRVKLNTYLIEENKRIEEENISLEKQREKEFYKLNEVKAMLRTLQQQLEEAKENFERNFDSYVEALELAYQAKENEFDSKVRLLQEQTNQKCERSKEESWRAFEKYVEGLDEYYVKVEKDFDKSLKDIQKIIEEHREELEQIRQTYAAAREAQIREEEIANQADFYSLHLTELEKSTISLIEELKPRIPEPRVLCMLIWTTFFQKQTTALCNQVLGAMPVCGIYKITNKITGLCYIGQAVNVADRWKQHVKCGLGIDTPSQNKLYKAMLKDGVINFTFELLEQCDKQLLNEKERFYINLYQAYEFGYNSTKGNN
jgi:hypothetical protein